MFDALKEYKGKHGNCNVSHSYTENKRLYRWVMRQHKDYRDKKISNDHIKRLEDIGFVIGLRKSLNVLKWETMFTILKEYKKKHGHCRIPENWEKNKSLGTWVGNQRASYRKKKLSADRIKRLENIGFVWNIHK